MSEKQAKLVADKDPKLQKRQRTTGALLGFLSFALLGGSASPAAGIEQELREHLRPGAHISDAIYHFSEGTVLRSSPEVPENPEDNVITVVAEREELGVYRPIKVFGPENCNEEWRQFVLEHENESGEERYSVAYVNTTSLSTELDPVTGEYPMKRFRIRRHPAEDTRVIGVGEESYLVIDGSYMMIDGKKHLWEVRSAIGSIDDMYS